MNLDPLRSANAIHIAPNAATAQPRPGLLVSIHDVSPLTLESSRRAVELVESAGVPRSALTVFAIARHEDLAPLDEHRPTCDWLRDLADAGACLAMHGLTHRMAHRASNPWQWAWAHGFARGQAELFLCDAADCERRIESSRAIFRRAGLEAALSGFVPPAWLLSPAALTVVKRAGFLFYELLNGIICGDEAHARGLIGFGSLSALEARLTAAYGWWQSCLSMRDTRFAIHPADVQRPFSEGSVSLILRRLLDKLEPRNYAEYLLLNKKLR